MVSSGTKWGKVGDYMFMGEYHHTIDDKGRIIIPSKIRYELGEEFIITRGLDNCLFVYKKDAFESIISKYKDFFTFLMLNPLQTNIVLVEYNYKTQYHLLHILQAITHQFS